MKSLFFVENSISSGRRRKIAQARAKSVGSIPNQERGVCPENALVRIETFGRYNRLECLF